MTVRFARRINKAFGRSGPLFEERYHARALRTPREVQHALRYVLNNARKHGADMPKGFVDACSSAPWFQGWTRPRALAFVMNGKLQARDPPVVPPKTWLLRVGYRRARGFDVDEAPG